MSQNLCVDTPCFDYGTLAAANAFQARQIADRIRQRSKDFHLETGRDLIAAQDMLGHGNFGKWLDAEFGWTDRTARNFMGAAKLVESKSEKISVLPMSAIYRLAAPSTPECARDAIIARVEYGERPSVKEIKSTIAEARKRDAEAHAEQTKQERRTPKARQRHQRLKEQRQLQQAREAEERQRRAIEAEEAAAEAVQMLVDRLGVDLPTFIERFSQAGCWTVLAKLLALQT
jgi:flagellar biosynthesis GTPase FlhF